MATLRSTLGRNVTTTCLVRGREAEGRKAVVVRKVRNSRVAGIGADGTMTAESLKVPTADVYDVQAVPAETDHLAPRISGVVGKRGVTTLPQVYRQALGLRSDDPILFELKDGAIVIHPARIGLRDEQTAANLDELLAGVTSENIHPEIDFGPPVGREVL